MTRLDGSGFGSASLDDSIFRPALRASTLLRAPRAAVEGRAGAGPAGRLPSAAGGARIPSGAPFVLSGLFRYLYLVNREPVGGSPAAPPPADGPSRSAARRWGSEHV